METHGVKLPTGIKAKSGMIPQPGNAKKAIDDPSAATTLLQLSMTLRLRFKVAEKLGCGSFGHIFKAFDTQRSEYVALKFESHLPNTNETTPMLTLGREARILSEIGGVTGIPTAHFFIKEETYSLLELNLLGPNLEKMFRTCNRKFSVNTTFLLAEEMLKRIEYVHSRGYLHRDIKPENFVIGNSSQDSRTLYLIDFGLSKLYTDPATRKHIPYRENKGLVGTARYVSIWTHLGIEQSRRDDLEAIGYLLIYFIKGSLPWQNVQAKCKNEKYKYIADLKTNTSIEDLCKGIPQQFALYMKYVRNLTFTDTPDYRYLKRLFRKDNDVSACADYDWNLNFSKPDGTSQRNADAAQNQKENSLMENLKGGFFEGAGAHKTNLRINITPANFYSKHQTSTYKSEDSVLADSPRRNESKGFGPYLQNKKNNIQVVKKHQIQLRQSIVRHSNNIEWGNFESKPLWIPAPRLSTEGKEDEGSRVPIKQVPRLDLSKTKLREIIRPKPKLGNRKIDIPAVNFDSYPGTLLSPGYRSCYNVMREKPAFTVCGVAKGESEDTESLPPSLKENQIQDTRFLRSTAAHRRADISPRLSFKPIKTLKLKIQEDYDFTGDDINERNNFEVAIYHLPQALSVKKLEELKASRKKSHVQNNKVAILKLPRSARSMRDCRDIVLLRNSMISTGTEVHKVSFLGDS